METLWSIMAIRKACPATPYGLFLKTAKGSFGLELQAESTVFAIHVVATFSQVEGIRGT